MRADVWVNRPADRIGKQRQDSEDPGRKSPQVLIKPADDLVHFASGNGRQQTEKETAATNLLEALDFHPMSTADTTYTTKAMLRQPREFSRQSELGNSSPVLVVLITALPSG